jgi:hypothetical protein
MNSIPLNFNISYNAQNSINKIDNNSCENNKYPTLDNDIQYPINNDWVMEETDMPIYILDIDLI